jgi:hypothetical protein
LRKTRKDVVAIMAENTQIVGAVSVANDSRQRVAFDMMQLLRGFPTEKQDEILELYARCLIVTNDPHLGVESIKKLAKGQSI